MEALEARPRVAASGPEPPEDVSRDELLARLGDPSLTIVDVLPSPSFAEAHIPGAVSLPLEDLGASATTVLADRAREIVVYCASVTCPRAEQAASLLRELGYSRVRHYHGGLADWQDAGAPIEGAAAQRPSDDHPRALTREDAPSRRSVPLGRHRARRRWQQWGNTLLDAIDRQSTSHLFLFYLAMIAGCGVLYWLTELSGATALVSGGQPVRANLSGLATAIYFSFATATSVGYGDVVPVGPLRFLSIGEAIAGLLIFGAVVAKFVSRRQDELVREIHRVTFEERLDRVQTNLHLVLSEMQAIAALCDSGGFRTDRLGARLESAALVFAGELRSIRDLLYRPERAPEEAVLGAILASLAASLHELSEVLACLPSGLPRSATLAETLTRLARLAEDICGECVPRRYAPALTVWMDRVQQIARRIS